MNLSNYLEKLYHKDISLTKTNLGLTNTIYKANIDGVDVSIRVPNDDIHHLINIGEKEVLDLIKNTDLDVEELFYDINTGIRITKWVDNTQNFYDSNDKDKDIKAIKLIKKLHSYKFKVSKSFDTYKMYRGFKDAIERPLFNYEDYEYLFKLYDEIEAEEILCHNDLVSGNFLFTKDKDYLIDYEYAGMNKIYFDIMSFISENNIDEEPRREIIYKGYFNREINYQERHYLLISEMMMNLLWATWANMLYDKRQNEEYLLIYKDKIEHLLKGISRI